MTDFKNLDDPELKGLFRKYFLRGLFFIILLALVVFTVVLTFEPEIRGSAQWITNQFGFFGISAMVFISDLVLSPFPPDMILFFMGKSPLHSNWILWVPILGLVSSFAGVLGWFVGKRLQHIEIVNRTLVYYASEHRDAIKRYGFWMVVLGALTPLPFSITCWLAGIFKLNLKSHIVACLFRIPRFLIYYWAIFYSGEFGALLRNFFSS